MLGGVVPASVARKERGEGAKRIARELAVDRKTVKRWRRLGSLPAAAKSASAPTNRAIHRVRRPARAADRMGRCGTAPELRGLGVYRNLSAGPALSPTVSGNRKCWELATVHIRDRAGRPCRSTTVSSRSGSASQPETVHLFALTLGYSRRLFTYGIPMKDGQRSSPRACVPPLRRSYAYLSGRLCGAPHNRILCPSRLCAARMPADCGRGGEETEGT
jgi:hypothetical protein